MPAAVAGTGGLNVPMFIALRRFTLLCTIVLERIMYHKKHDPSTYGAITTMIAGTDLRARPVPRAAARLHT